jgi:hypothetical protein
LAELGIVAAQGREGIKELLTIIASEEDARLPVDAHAPPARSEICPQRIDAKRSPFPAVGRNV